MVRPSYVLGGRGMEVVHDSDSLVGYMNAAVGVTPDRPILIDRFLIIYAMECGERTQFLTENTPLFRLLWNILSLPGVHSGDSACILPSLNIPEENVKTINEYTKKIAEEMGVVGLMNMQYAIEDGKVCCAGGEPESVQNCSAGIKSVQYKYGQNSYSDNDGRTYRKAVSAGRA